MAHEQLIYLFQMVIFHSYVSLPEGILLMSFLHQPIFADRTDHKKHDQLTDNTCSNANGWRHGNCWWDFHWIMLHCKSNKYPYGSSRIFLGSGTGVWFGGLSTFLDSVWIHRVWMNNYEYSPTLWLYDPGSLIYFFWIWCLPEGGRHALSDHKNGITSTW